MDSIKGQFNNATNAIKTAMTVIASVMGTQLRLLGDALERAMIAFYKEMENNPELAEHCKDAAPQLYEAWQRWKKDRSE